jgi:two-component system, cell cycle response regulator
LDIDDFKPYNDVYTHAAGDQALVCVAEALRESIRADDIVARYRARSSS